MKINGLINDNYTFIFPWMFFRLAKPMFFLFDVCNNDSYCDKWDGVGVRTRS